MTVYALPACSISCSPSCAVCEGETVTLTEDGEDAVSWLWSTGETTQSIAVTTGGTYTVTVTDANGCENTCTKDVTVYDLWSDINIELSELIDKVNAAEMPNIIKQRLVDKLEYAKELKDNAKEECEAGNFEAATKKLGVAKSQVESFESMVRITRRISEEDKENFLAESAKIKAKIDELIEYIETEHKCC